MLGFLASLSASASTIAISSPACPSLGRFLLEALRPVVLYSPKMERFQLSFLAAVLSVLESGPPRPRTSAAASVLAAALAPSFSALFSAFAASLFDHLHQDRLLFPVGQHEGDIVACSAGLLAQVQDGGIVRVRHDPQRPRLLVPGQDLGTGQASGRALSRARNVPPSSSSSSTRCRTRAFPRTYYSGRATPTVCLGIPLPIRLEPARSVRLTAAGCSWDFGCLGRSGHFRRRHLSSPLPSTRRVSVPGGTSLHASPDGCRQGRPASSPCAGAGARSGAAAAAPAVSLPWGWRSLPDRPRAIPPRSRVQDGFPRDPQAQQFLTVFRADGQTPLDGQNQ